MQLVGWPFWGDYFSTPTNTAFDFPDFVFGNTSCPWLKAWALGLAHWAWPLGPGPLGHGPMGLAHWVGLIGPDPWAEPMGQAHGPGPMGRSLWAGPNGLSHGPMDQAQWARANGPGGPNGPNGPDPMGQAQRAGPEEAHGPLGPWLIGSRPSGPRPIAFVAVDLQSICCYPSIIGISFGANWR
jgi:hypothetical protein